MSPEQVRESVVRAGPTARVPRHKGQRGQLGPVSPSHGDPAMVPWLLRPGVTQLAPSGPSASSNAMVTLISKQHLEGGPVTSASPLETPSVETREDVP